MIRVDPIQFGEENKMLFKEGSWYIFLDLGDFTKKGYYPRLAHRCDLVERMKRGKPYEWSKRHSCCLVFSNNNRMVCRDCKAIIPVVLNGFYNLAKWSFE